MNKRQKIVQEAFLDNEEAVIKRLKQVYGKSLSDITAKAERLQKEFEELSAEYDTVEDEAEREILKSRMQSKVYQKKYQEGLKKQVNDILNDMQAKEYKTVSDYLNQCYEDGFVGAMYDLQGQGIPMCFPLDQEAMVQAVQLDSPISQGLYSRLGEDVSMLKKKITAQVSRGIATGMTYAQVAKQLSGYTNIGFNNAVRIARTEGHRIQVQSAMNACYKAKEKGADVVKQWDSTLDAKTRESHAMVDREIKELDEKFSNGLMYPGDPSGGAAEVVNCRCALNQRGTWLFNKRINPETGKEEYVDGYFTKMNNFTKKIEEFESPEDYKEFKKAFFSKENRKYMNYVEELEERYGTKNFEKLLGKMSDREYKHFMDLQSKSPLYNKNALTNTVKDDKIIISKNTIDDCTSTEEVVELFKSHTDWFYELETNGKLIRSVDGIHLDGVDLESAKAVYRPFEAVLEKYPQLKGKLNGVSSANIRNDAYADCFFGLGHGGISVSKKYYSNIEKLTKALISDEAYGFHPKGVLNPDSIVMHELGHAIDDYLSYTLNLGGFTNKGKVKTVSAMLRPKVMKNCGLTTRDIATEVSGYATKDSLEWFAECFAEYMCSDNPRKVATELGKQLDEIMKGVK